jgi:hypothetical protein
MKKDINFKLLNNNMLLKRISILLLILLLCGMGHSASYTKDEVLKYRFEEGTGNILIDSSGNGYSGIKSGATYDSGTKMFGNYALRFDGNDDWAESVIQMPLYEYMTYSVWVYKESQSNTRTIFFVQNNNLEHFKVSYNHTTDLYHIFYECCSGNINNIQVPASGITTNTWHNIMLGVDYNANALSFYIDGVLLYNQTQPTNFTPIDNNNYVALGKSITGVDEFKGRMDEFTYYNFLLNSTQITELITTNSVTFNDTEVVGEDEPEEDADEFSTDERIIKSYNPFINSSIYTTDNIVITLNKKASCEVYIDNELYAKDYNKLAYSFTHDLEVGNYNVIYYCHYDLEGVKYYQLTQEIPFSVVENSPSIINFIVTGSDYNVADKSLYIVTPCIKHILQVSGITDGLSSEINKDKEFYFQKLNNNGIASFNLTQNTHEFCLVNGMVQYSENDFTTDYNVNKVEGIAQMGEFNIPSNVTQTYYIGTELLDIYDKTNPKAFDLTWASIMGGLVLTFFAIILMLIGVFAKEPKVVMAGTIVLLSAFGVSFSGVVLGAIF